MHFKANAKTCLFMVSREAGNLRKSSFSTIVFGTIEVFLQERRILSTHL